MEYVILVWNITDKELFHLNIKENIPITAYRATQVLWTRDRLNAFFF